MKKLIFSFVLLFISSSPTVIFSWDSTAAKFYPLAVGNKWSYHRYTYQQPLGCISPTSNYYYIQQIISDTLMPNGHKYYKFSGLLGIYYHRIDSLTMNVYNSAECLVDSLLARKNDTVRGCGLTSLINDTPMVNFAGQLRRTKHYVFLSGSKTLMYGIGVFTDYYCELFQGHADTLTGCIINGIQYGNIIGVEKIASGIPEKYLLYQNYPNPFNPSTHLRFGISELRFVSLKIFDVIGKEIKNLVNQKLKPGIYEVEFYGENLPSGVYYYSLDAGVFKETKKMVLVK